MGIRERKKNMKFAEKEVVEYYIIIIIIVLSWLFKWWLPGDLFSPINNN